MATPAIHCRVECADRKAHLFAITLTVAKPAALQRLALAAWIPGSYLLREFSKNLQQLRAHQGRRKLAVSQLDKASWEIACTPGKPLVLRYDCLLYTSPSPRDGLLSRMPSSA